MIGPHFLRLRIQQKLSTHSICALQLILFALTKLLCFDLELGPGVPLVAIGQPPTLE